MDNGQFARPQPVHPHNESVPLFTRCCSRLFPLMRLHEPAHVFLRDGSEGLFFWSDSGTTDKSYRLLPKRTMAAVFLTLPFTADQSANVGIWFPISISNLPTYQNYPHVLSFSLLLHRDYWWAICLNFFWFRGRWQKIIAEFQKMADGHCHGHCCNNDSEEKASQTHTDGDEASAKTATSSHAAALKDLEK